MRTQRLRAAEEATTLTPEANVKRPGPTAARAFRWPAGPGAFAATAVMVATLGLGPADAGTGDISTVAGNGSSGLSGDGGAATEAQLSFPFGVVADAAGNLFVADHSNSRIRRIDAATGVITTAVGTTSGFGGDGGPAAEAQIDGPVGLDVDPDGNLYIADFNNQRIRRVDAATSIITTVAGTGVPGYNGDGVPATAARLNFPFDVDVDPGGNLLIADLSNSRVRRVDAATSVITTVAGTGEASFGGDGGPAAEAALNRPQGVTTDDAGNLFIADSENSRIRRVDAATSVITTVETPDASLHTPAETAVDPQGNLFIADTGNNRILRVDAASGALSVVAGGGTGGDGGPATAASLNLPYDVDVSMVGDLLVADTYNHRIRLVEGSAFPGGSTTTTVADTTTSTSTTSTTSTSTTSTSTTSTSTTSSTSTSTTTTSTSTTTTTIPVAPTCDGLVPTITGTEGPDTILGTNGDDVIAGLGGDDFLVAGGGNDVVCGGAGNDTIDGRIGNDRMFGGDGNDTMVGNAGNDELSGDRGADDISGDAGDDVLRGGTDDDKLRGGAGNDQADGGAGNDAITDGPGDDDLRGGTGHDVVRGGEGTDDLDGGTGDDRLLGEGGDDTLAGGIGDDRLNGGDGSDDCNGGLGANSINNCEDPLP